MTVEECYKAMGGNYADVVSRLRTDERIKKFLLKVLDDGSYALLVKNLGERNIEEAFRAAHTLKGVSMNLSLTTLFSEVNRLTEALRGRHEYGDDIAPLMTAVTKEYEKTVARIRELAAE
ncbi:MAG: Hpt domain-containing protein [Roseburia sp.]|nr:Hpt domain-containing protein [Roseburia sp.]